MMDTPPLQPTQSLAHSSRPSILGIVNITPDSFSDGGRYLDPARALDHALELWRAGADLIDVGGASSHPLAPHVEASMEIARITPLLGELARHDIPVSVDSCEPETQRFALSRGVAMLNDVRGFPHPEIYPELARARCRLVVMHRQPTQTDAPPASDGDALIARIIEFFEERTRALERAGVARERLILDPGMGLFLGPGVEASLAVMRGLTELRGKLGLPLLLGVSRKSWLATLTDGNPDERPPSARGAATLAAELHAARAGVEYLRTHDVRALRDGLEIERALRTPARVSRVSGEHP